MDNDNHFKYDPEEEDESNAKKYRLPFALCKAAGIQVEDWWRPRDAWEALRRGGHIDNVSDAYADYYRQKKKERAKERRAQKRERDKRKAEQLADEKHNPDKGYTHKEGFIAGAVKSAPMDFEKADSGSVNPYYGKGLIGYRTNCQTCVATYIARRQGYNVRALPNLNNKSIADLSRDCLGIYKDANGQKIKVKNKPSGKPLKRFLDENVEENRIYSLDCQWKGRSTGHIVTVERTANGVRVYDPQTNDKYENKQITQFFRNGKDFKLADLTNCRLDEMWADKIMKKG